jgi:hypothetical protein
MPILLEDVDRMKKNSITWKTYEETDDDKKVYVKKTVSSTKVIEVSGIEEEKSQYNK